MVSYRATVFAHIWFLYDAFRYGARKCIRTRWLGELQVRQVFS